MLAIFEGDVISIIMEQQNSIDHEYKIAQCMGSSSQNWTKANSWQLVPASFLLLHS